MFGGLDILEDLQKHPDSEIYDATCAMIDTFFIYEDQDEVDDLQSRNTQSTQD